MVGPQIFTLPEPDEKTRHKLARVAPRYRAFPLAEVIERHDLTESLMKLIVRPRVSSHLHVPGQYCTLWLEGAEPRPYSIVSAPHEDFLEFFIELIPGANWEATSLSPRLWGLNVGDTVTIFGSAQSVNMKGTFTLRANHTAHIFVATVTGIAPFVSMLCAYRAGYYGEAMRGQIYVLQGASHHDEFGYDQELEAMERAGMIRYEKTVSQEPGREKELGRNSGWHGNVGRVNEIFFKLLQKQNLMLRHDGTMGIYLCGNGGMITDMRNITPPQKNTDPPLGKLIVAGFPKEHIYWEEF